MTEQVHTAANGQITIEGEPQPTAEEEQPQLTAEERLAALELQCAGQQALLNAVIYLHAELVQRLREKTARELLNQPEILNAMVAKMAQGGQV
jgi:hypothetical protein